LPHTLKPQQWLTRRLVGSNLVFEVEFFRGLIHVASLPNKMEESLRREPRNGSTVALLRRGVRTKSVECSRLSDRHPKGEDPATGRGFGRAALRARAEGEALNFRQN